MLMSDSSLLAQSLLRERSRGAVLTLRPDHHLVRVHPLARRPSRRTSTPDDLSVPGNLPGLHGALRRLLIRSTGPCRSPFKANSGSERDCLPAGVGVALRRAHSRPARKPVDECPTNSSLDHVSDRIVLGSPPFRGFSLFVPLHPLGSSFPPCLFVRPCGRVASRTSALCSTSGRPCGHPLAVLRTAAFRLARVVHTYESSLLSWSFSPFEDYRDRLRLRFADLSLAPCGTRSPVSLRVSTKLLS